MFNFNSVMEIKAVYIEGTCEDCGKVIVSGSEDAISLFGTERCAVCEAGMYEYMEDYAAKQDAEFAHSL